MLYDIKLVIDYSYHSASDHVRNVLRLLPSDGPNQRVLSRMLTIAPAPDERRDSVDFFGNDMTLIAWHEPIDQITLRLRAKAERLPLRKAPDTSPDLQGLAAEIADVQDLGPLSPQHFLPPSPLITPNADMIAYARAHLAEEQTCLALVKTLGHALFKEMKYDAEATDVNTPIAEAFENRHGVCQDFAQIMIACLRSLGVPSGYVSGFLRTYPPEGQPRLEGVDAMHAWVSAWCGEELGWVEYDPTNGQFAGEDYITVAHGRDYSDVAPVKGAIRTAGGQDSHQAVDVIPLG